MSDNIIFLLNKLSYHIVATNINDDKFSFGKQKNERYFKKCVRKITQKGCDVLLEKIVVPPLPDPCITEYGGNWSPVTLLTDYAKDFGSKGATKYHDILMNSVNCLQDGDYDRVNEVLKFLLIMKGPFFETQLQNDVLSMCGSDFLMSPISSFAALLDEPFPYVADSLSRQTSFKRALKYEESWTKNFDSKFQVLGEYSKKNLLTPEKVSFDSLFSAKSTVTSRSQSNPFVFTDFSIEKNYQSEKNLFDLSKNTCYSDVPLLDSFVDNPISHKLPTLTNNSKGISKSTYFVKSADQMKRKLHLLKEEDQYSLDSFPQERTESNDFSDLHKLSSKNSGFELKRNSNCSHSFAILYEKSMSYKTDEPSLSSHDSLLLIRDKKKNKAAKNVSSKDSYCSSKEIILGLWEHDKAIMKEFRPELASTMPILRMITMVEFVEDVKYLLTGINSGSFKYDTEENCFHLEFGTCLSDVTPESLFHFSKEFIETGDYYMKLSTCATENGRSNLENCTSVSQAFWKSIFDYLELHYSMVLAIPVTTNLMMLKSCVKDIHEMIVSISHICKVTRNEPLPEGGQLLAYLLQTIEKLNINSVKNTAYGILQNCCSVYFNCILQPWLFKGHLEKDNSEFFIEHSKQSMNPKSRNYYCSFSIVPEKIPCFLLGFEESIFHCGKSVHFLKLFNSEDKFCQLLEKLSYPKMRLCLSDNQLENLEKEFKDYEKRAIELCGKSVSIASIRNEEKEKERKFAEFVQKYKEKQEEERRLSKLKNLEELKAKKEAQNKLLTEEILKMREEKERRKAEEKEAIRKIEEKIMRAKENEKALISQEKNLLINYYNKLFRNLDTQLNVIEVRKRKLQDILSDPLLILGDPRILDILNDNMIERDSFKSETLSNQTMSDTQSVDSNSNPLTRDELSLPSIDSVSEESVDLEMLANLPQVDVNSISMDENSNFQTGEDADEASLLSEAEKIQANENNCKAQEKEQEARKSVSQRTVAATEAARNKIKILRSEFGMSLEHYPVKSKPPAVAKKVKALATAPDSKKKDSDYDILKFDSESILVRSVTSQTEIPKENLKKKNLESPKKLKSSETVSLREALNFREVGLERKRECLNLENALELKASKGSEMVASSNSDSFSSFLTPPATILSEEIIPNNSTTDEKKKEGEEAESAEKEPESEEEEEEEEEIVVEAKSTSASLLTNPQYQNALVRDADISNHKLSYEEIFQSANPTELDHLPCTDLLKFQRYLRKSVLIPLVVQEKLANDALLKHLIVGENLLSHLKSLRGFFFFNDGEFGRNFTHNTFRSLAICREPCEFFEKSNLSNILNESLNFSIQGSEKNAQNLSFKIVKMPPFLNHASHDVLSPFELSYKVEWPLNVILTDKALARYKTIFRFLLKLKRISWTLNENCLHLNAYFKNRKLEGHVLASSSHYHKIQIYRHAMTQVVITLNDYIFSSGIQLPWINFLQDLETTANIDHLYQKHVRYIKDVLLRCFLTKNSKDLLNCIHNVIELALKFHYTTVSSSMIVVEGKYEHPKFDVLKTTFNEFCIVIKTFLRTLKEKIATNQIIKSHYILIEKFDLKLT